MNLSPSPVQQFFDNNGRPLVGGLLFTYEAGTSIKAETYLDEAGTPNTNPIELDFRGECRLWLDPEKAYKFVLSPRGDTDPPTRPIWTADNITSALSPSDIGQYIDAVVDQQYIGQRLWPRTPDEVTAGVTPTNYAIEPNHLLRYGAVPGGVFDNTVAIRDAIKVVAVSGGTLYFPAGLFTFSGAIELGRNITYSGQGKSIDVTKCTVLKYTGDQDAFYDLNPVDTPTAANMRFEHMGFWYGTATESQKKGLFHLLGSTFVDFDDCGIYGGEFGIILDQAELVNIRQCDFENQTVGMIWLVNGDEKTPGAGELFTNRIAVQESQFNSNAAVAIVDDGGIAHVFSNNNFNHGATHIRLCGVEGCVITGNELEIATGDSISTHTTKYGGGTPGVDKCRGLNIIGNYIFQTGAISAAINIVGASVATATIIGNDIQTNTGIGPVTGFENADSIMMFENFQRGSGLPQTGELSYAEGNWTPVVEFGGASTGIAGSFSGRYTRIGRQVFCHCELAFSNKGSATGDMTVSGLPFESAPFSTYAVPAGFVENLANSLQLQAWVQESSTEIVVQKGGGTSTAAVTNADIQNNTRIDFSFNYLVA